MRTVKSMKEELAKFPDDALCNAYEGEVFGLIIKPANRETDGPVSYGVIHCGESTPEADEPETDLLN